MSLLLNKFRKQLKHRGQETIAYLFNYIKVAPSGPVRAVIFAQGRTGSALLESLLCSSGHFWQNGELLNTSKGEILFPTHFIRGLSKWKSNDNFIFHVKIYQLTRDRKRPIDPASFMETLYHDGWKVIYLRRKNKVKHTLSNVIANHRGAYHKFDDNKEEFNVFVDCENFAKVVNGRFRFEEAEKEILANIEYHEVVYEDDLERSSTHQKTVNRIFDYLSLEQREVTTRHRKVNTLPLEKLISNYDEFVDCLNKHGWQSFLD
jgi:hypothetical protein